MTATDLHLVRGCDYAAALRATGIAALHQLSPVAEVAAAIQSLAGYCVELPPAEHAMLRREAMDCLAAAKLEDIDVKRVLDAEIRIARKLERAAAARATPSRPTPHEELPEGVLPDSDLANACRLRRDHGDDLRFARELGWLVWDGKRWAQDSTGEVERRAHAIARALEAKAAELLGCAARAPSDGEAARFRLEAKRYEKWALRSQSEPRLRAAVELAKSLEGIAVRVAQLDADPWLLTCSNGTLDLRTGKLRQHERSDLITRAAPVEYVPIALAATWECFLERVLPDVDVRAFTQRALGYSLTGDTREQCLCVCHGGGANGKSTLIETVRYVLGDYASHAATDTFMRVSARGADNDLARLRGARFVTAIESGEGRRLDEERVKQLTGGDTITARYLYREPFEFRPAMKIWLACNHRPEIHGTDDGVWRRIRLVPFDVQIPEPERDAELGAKLRAEATGVLAWMVRGCLEWQNGGLRAPAAVTASTAEWRADSDAVAQFVDDQCVRGPYAKTAVGALYAAFVAWCRAQGTEPMPQQRFGRRLTALGFTGDRTNRGRFWKGLGLAAEGHDA